MGVLAHYIVYGSSPNLLSPIQMFRVSHSTQSPLFYPVTRLAGKGDRKRVGEHYLRGFILSREG